MTEPQYVEFPHQNDDIWKRVESCFISREIKSLDDFASALKEFNPKGSYHFFTDYIPQANAYSANGGITTEIFVNEVRLPPQTDNFRFIFRLFDLKCLMITSL
jgi:hypothetical protein